MEGPQTKKKFSSPPRPKRVFPTAGGLRHSIGGRNFRSLFPLGNFFSGIFSDILFPVGNFLVLNFFVARKLFFHQILFRGQLVRGQLLRGQLVRGKLVRGKLVRGKLFRGKLFLVWVLDGGLLRF
jgi:hypothetical protein